MTSRPPKGQNSPNSAAGGTNPPQKIAIALEEQDDSAPTVLASGRGHVAEKILELAFANDIRVREDSDLVQVLASVDVDSPIPTDAFAAVAEILTYLYQANGALAPDDLGAWND